MAQPMKVIARACLIVCPRLMAQSGCDPSFVGGFGFPVQAGGFADVYTIAAHDAGQGPRLWAAGNSPTASGQVFNNIAMFDGTAWEGTGGGVSSGPFSAPVFALRSYADPVYGPAPSTSVVNSRWLAESHATASRARTARPSLPSVPSRGRDTRTPS